MVKQHLILIGGGGHCKSCIDVIESAGEYRIAGILDVDEKVGMKVSGYEIIGTDAEIERLSDSTSQFLVTVGQIKSGKLRQSIFERLRTANRKIATVISPHAIVSKHSVIGQGTVIMHGAKVNNGARIGDNCIINTNANIEHDSIIGNHVHISTNAVINGDCQVSDGAFIGSNAVLINGIQVGPALIIGAGAVVIKSIADPGVYAGNPCYKIK